MASEYYWGYNVFQDVLINATLNEINISDDNFKSKLNGVFSQIIINYLENKSDIVYLDFEISSIGCKYELVANNFITALWLSGVFPDNVKYTIHNDEYSYDDGSFTYNKKTKKLKFKNITKNNKNE